jgi:hypothetical protein
MKEKLINAVIEQIKTDIDNGDLTALDELLRFIPEDYLEGFISEDLLEKLMDQGEQA